MSELDHPRKTQQFNNKASGFLFQVFFGVVWFLFQRITWYVEECH